MFFFPIGDGTCPMNEAKLWHEVNKKYSEFPLSYFYSISTYLHIHFGENWSCFFILIGYKIYTYKATLWHEDNTKYCEFCWLWWLHFPLSINLWWQSVTWVSDTAASIKTLKLTGFVRHCQPMCCNTLFFFFLHGRTNLLNHGNT